MIRIIYAVPENAALAGEIVATRQTEDISFEIIDHLDIEGLMACDLPNCIVIARGFKYLLLKSQLKCAHLIRMPITGYDVMYAIGECRRLYDSRKIAAILIDHVVSDWNFVAQTFGTQLLTYEVYDRWQLLPAYREALNAGVDTIIGGRSVSRMAEADNMQCVRILAGPETLYQAIDEAFSIAAAINEESKRNEFLRIILDNSDGGILAIDPDGLVTSYNKRALNLLRLPPNSNINGLKLEAVSPCLRDVLNQEESTNIVKKLGDKMILLNINPIVVEGHHSGAVLILQNVDTLQRTEIAVRKKLSAKGLVAKYSFADICGTSEALGRTITIAQRFAATDMNVLIIGETGTGKELFAQSIHSCSHRSREPFVAVNCATLPENLLESELFGYAEGAFTGATKGGKVGLFELAHKGTLFLDEISELPLGLQAKLLRVLQEREIRKLGDDRIIPIDVRIISATNVVDLHQKALKKEFRQDLYYRLDILQLNIPPLSSRKEDIRELAHHFFLQYPQGKSCQLTDEAVVELAQYGWPGNVRELRNICDRLLVLCEGRPITAQSVRDVLSDRIGTQSLAAEPAPVHDWPGAGGKPMTQQEIADILGISRTTLWKRRKQARDKADSAADE
jgi:propionate catabolism operon transcriptional regulator